MQLNLRFLDWIWHVKGSLPLAPEVSTDQAFEKLDALLQVPGTTYTRDQDRLIFQKKNQPAQDKMSIFDSGVLQVKEASQGKRLYYNLVSKTLLFCFLAPALFFGFGKVFEFTKEYRAAAYSAAAIHTHPKGGGMGRRRKKTQ